MSFSGVHKLQIFPLNQRQTYSFSEGNPIINLQIGRQNGFVRGQSVYLNFKLHVAAPDGNAPTNGNAGVTAEHQLFLNERVGAWSVIDRITVSEASRNQTIEGVRDVGRVLAAVRPACISPMAMNTNFNCKSLNATRTQMTARLLNNPDGIEVSLMLAEVSGFLAHDLIPLNLIPLNISIQLAPDAQALEIPTDAAGTSAGYHLSDVSLSADMLLPGPDMKMPTNTQIGFDSYSNIFNVQNSTNQTTSVQLGLANVKSVFTTVMPPDHQNNIKRDSFSTGEFLAVQPAPGVPAVESKIDRVSFLRGAQNYPIENELEVKAESDAGTPLTPVLKHGLRSVGRRNARTVVSTMASPATQVGLLTGTMMSGQAFSNVSVISGTQEDKLRIYGVDLDSYSGAGLDFRGVTCGLRVNMDASSPMGLHTTAVARNVMTVENGAVSVVS